MQKISTPLAPKAIGPYSQAISHDGMLYTSGQIPLDLEGNIVGEDIATQTEQVITNLGAILDEAGTDFSKVIKTTCYLADMSLFATFNEVYSKYFTSCPARSTVAVKSLPKQVLVEIEVIAYI